MNNESKGSKSVKVEGGIGEKYAIIRFKNGRYVVEQEDGTRLLKLEEEEKIREIAHKGQEGIVCFEVEREGKIGMLQIQKVFNKEKHIKFYNLGLEANKWHNGTITSEQAMVVLCKYQKVDLPFGAYLPRVYLEENGKQLQMIYNTKEDLPLTNTLGEKIKYYKRNKQFVCCINGKTKIVNELNEELIEEQDIDVMKSADIYSSIRPSGKKYPQNVWRYNANGRVGIIYLEEQGINRYILTDIPFEEADKVLYINEHYILVDGKENQQTVSKKGEYAKLYYKGTYLGQIQYFKPKGISKYFLNTYRKCFIGKTAIMLKPYENMSATRIEECKEHSSNIKEITISNGAIKYRYYLNLTTGEAKEIR